MTGKNVFALTLVAVGVIIFLNIIIPEFSIGRIFADYWPVILILLGGSTLLRSPRAPFGALVILFIGVYFLLKNLSFLPDNSTGIFWASALVLAGFWILFSRKGSETNKNLDQATVNHIAIMSGNETRNTTGNFKGGSVFALMGAVELDLRDAQLDSNGAFLELTAIMGGVEVRVPEDWIVESNSLPLLGSCENHTRGKQDEAGVKPVLKLQSTAIMGGIEVKN